jgi:hypothetical protein
VNDVTYFTFSFSILPNITPVIFPSLSAKSVLPQPPFIDAAGASS